MGDLLTIQARPLPDGVDADPVTLPSHPILYAEQAQYHGVHAVDTRRHLRKKYPRSTAL
jgi:hypothetical protein